VGSETVGWFVDKEYGFPIYWVPQRVGRVSVEFTASYGSLVSNLLGSPASGELKPLGAYIEGVWSFQFIGFPSEWGAYTVGQTPDGNFVYVSNLLGSPASGEGVMANSPEGPVKFPIYWVPQRVGSFSTDPIDLSRLKFPIYWVPQRVGSIYRGSVAT